MTTIQSKQAAWCGVTLCAALLTPVSLAADSSASAKASAKASAQAGTQGKPVLTVTTITPRASTLPLQLQANGNVAAWQEASIGAEVNGLRLQELHANVGDFVKRGQLLASFADETVKAELAQAQAALSEAQATAHEASANATRARNLRTSGALSDQQIDQFLGAEQHAKARLEYAQAGLNLQQLRLKNTRVLAPDSGQISARTGALGAVVNSGSELFRMIRQNRLEWRAEVTSAEIERIHIGTQAIITSPAGKPIQGRVRQIAANVDPQTRLGLVYVDLINDQPNLAGAFKPGMFVRGEFGMGSSSALIIPQQALVARDGFQYGFRLNPDGRVTQIKLQTGRRIEQAGVAQVEILAGLNPNSVLVANGAGFLSDGDLVKVVNPPVPDKNAPSK